MKRSLIIILSLVLCLLLSCNEETLDKVFIQGGMDKVSPKVVVAVDPDRVEAFERGELVVESNSIPVELLEGNNDSVIEVRIVSGGVDRVTKDDLDKALSYVDTALSDVKDEVVSYVDEKVESSFTSVPVEKVGASFSIEEIKEYVDSSFLTLKSEIVSYIDEKADEALAALNTLGSRSVDINVNGSSETEYIEKYADSILSVIKDEINSYLDEKMEEVYSAVAAIDLSSFEEVLASNKDELVSYVDGVAKEKSDEILKEIDAIFEAKLNNEGEVVSDTTEEETIFLVDQCIVRNGIWYIETDEGYEVVGHEEDISSLIIPEFIDGLPVVAIKEGAFKDSLTLKGDVVLPKSLERIESEAFMNCRNIDGKLYIPSSLETIGDRAFYGCEKLSGDLIIPDSVETIGDEAFAYCRKLGKAVYGGRGLLFVGEGVFESSSVEKSNFPLEVDL